MSDPTSIATLDVLTKVLAPALYMDANLYALVICRAVSLSIEHGNNDGSCLSYVWFSTIAGLSSATTRMHFDSVSSAMICLKSVA